MNCMENVALHYCCDIQERFRGTQELLSEDMDILDKLLKRSCINGHCCGCIQGRGASQIVFGY
jgi:hypothetical protein